MEHRLNLVLKNFGFLLPYFFAGAGICLLIRYFAYRSSKKSKADLILLREVCILIFAGYLTALVVALFHGGADSGQINLIPFSQIADYFDMIGNNTGAFIVYLFGNVFSFTPFAFFLPIVFERIRPGQGIGICFLASVLTEMVQHFLSRFSDIDDVILNTLGAAIGAGLFVILKKANPDAVSRWQGKQRAPEKPGPGERE